MVRSEMLRRGFVPPIVPPETPTWPFPMSVIREAYVQPHAPNGKELAVLHVIAELEQQHGAAPHFGQVASHYGITRQAVHYWVKRLRAKQLVEPGAGAGHALGANAPPIVMTDAGRLAVATSA